MRATPIPVRDGFVLEALQQSGWTNVFTVFENPDTGRRRERLADVPTFAFMARAATRDVALEGAENKEGDRVLLWYLFFNRDESVSAVPNHVQRDPGA